ncbi:hypothetical protein [Flexivirga oryzae]|uniref:Uncharacterized protein n=1 Tax=Flexivirga oryzae TaxID=1794944 RepID=A0A839N9C9_9MICO|nr:hypothetical protein [Flexivirga oryzae]MBB2891341.1 hypothetical protein [Flexivirga oryzae]
MKILMRGGMLPQDNYGALDLLESDRFGSNIGNLIYQFSVVRTLLTDDVEFHVDNYATNPARAAEINEKYDLYVVPLADAFRDDFVTNLTNYAKLIEQLTSRPWRNCSPHGSTTTSTSWTSTG